MTIYATACAACMAACACALAADAPANTAKAPQSTGLALRLLLSRPPDVVEFLGQISEKHGIPLEWLKDEVAVARYSETAERLMTPKPGIRKPGSDVVKSPFRNYLAYARRLPHAGTHPARREFIEPQRRHLRRN